MASVEVCSLHIGTYPMGNFNPAPDWVGCKQFLNWDTCAKTERTERDTGRERGRGRISLRPILQWQAVTEWRGFSTTPGFINLGHMVHTNKKLQHGREGKCESWWRNVQSSLISASTWLHLKLINIILTEILIRRRDALSERWWWYLMKRARGECSRDQTGCCKVPATFFSDGFKLRGGVRLTVTDRRLSFVQLHRDKSAQTANSGHLKLSADYLWNCVFLQDHEP